MSLRGVTDAQIMSAALLAHVAPAGSQRLLADVQALGRQQHTAKAPALERLEALIGHELADRLVVALSDRRGDPRDRAA